MRMVAYRILFDIFHINKVWYEEDHLFTDNLIT